MLYYVYRRQNGLTLQQQADIFERSYRPERTAANARSPLLGRANSNFLQETAGLSTKRSERRSLRVFC